jgi:hypothetical protein
MGCVTWICLVGGFLFLVMTLIRWFDETARAVDDGAWQRVQLLIIFPFGVWFFASGVGAGRAIPVPRHEPVRGFGAVPTRSVANAESHSLDGASPVKVLPVSEGNQPLAYQSPADEPPPGTPKEFLGLPRVPPDRAQAKRTVDPEKIAKLKQKMREQGMLPPDEPRRRDEASPEQPPPDER